MASWAASRVAVASASGSWRLFVASGADSWRTRSGIDAVADPQAVAFYEADGFERAGVTIRGA